MEPQTQLSQQHPPCQNQVARSQTPSLQNVAAWCQGTSLATCQQTAFAWSQQQQGERQWQRAYRRRPTPLKTQEKMTETEARSPLATVNACTVPGWSIPGKMWMPTNQIRDLSAGAHAPRKLRARALQASRGI